MLETTPNMRNVSLKLKRGQIIDLAIACTEIANALEPKDRTKWESLHDELMTVITIYDSQHGIG